MKDESLTLEIMDWLEGRLDEEAEKAFLARQAADPELARECGLMAELLASLAQLDEDLTPSASFRQNVMTGVRAMKEENRKAEDGTENRTENQRESGAGMPLEEIPAAGTKENVTFTNVTFTAEDEAPREQRGEKKHLGLQGEGKAAGLFRRLGLGTVLPVAACLLVLVIVLPKLGFGAFQNTNDSLSGGAYTEMDTAMSTAPGAAAPSYTGKNKENGFAVEMQRDGGESAGSGIQSPEASSPESESQEAADMAADLKVSVSRKIIRNGHLTLEVDSFDETMAALNSAVEEQGGYVVSQNRQSIDDKNRLAGNITVKVPYDRFDELLTMARQLGKATDEQVDAQDVTDQYIDITARIEVYRTKLDRLLELLKQSGDLSEVLAVENELASTRAELESLEGQLRYLDSQTSYSRLSLYVTEKPVEASEIRTDGLAGFWQDVQEAFLLGMNALIGALSGFVISLAGWLPALAIIAVTALILWRVWLKKWWGRQK